MKGKANLWRLARRVPGRADGLGAFVVPTATLAFPLPRPGAPPARRYSDKVEGYHECRRHCGIHLAG